MSERRAPFAGRNVLLAGLPDQEYQHLAGDLERIDGVLGDPIIREYQRPEWAYFPEEAVLSIVRILEDGSMIEVGVVGFDGMVGFQSLAEDAEQVYRVIVQNPGAILRLSMRRLREEFKSGGTLQGSLLRYSSSFLLQVSQTAACNRLHTVDRRLARWLLMMRDRTTTSELRLTQEFLSHMLGTRIAGVNEAIHSLSSRSLVKHGRGRIKILDREGLAAAACECNGFVRNLTSSPPATSV